VPSILVGNRVHTNPAEETRLRDDGHRRELAIAVLGGVRNYFERCRHRARGSPRRAARRNGTSLASTAVSAQAAPAVAADASAVSSDAVKASTRVPAAEKDAGQGRLLRRRRRRSQAVAPTENVRDLHRVNRGETLTGIASQYGVSVGALKMANKMNDDNVRIGSVMVIPSG